MYDYMKALQRQFETDCQSIQDLNDEVSRTHKELSSRLAKEDRKLLLRLVDMEDSLRGHASPEHRSDRIRLRSRMGAACYFPKDTPPPR